jgi:hypothetical protein
MDREGRFEEKGEAGEKDLVHAWVFYLLLHNKLPQNLAT